MTPREQLMYKIIGKLSEMDAPIVFKGALITKLVLSENSYTALERMTIDIDGDWVDVPPTMDYLIETINKSLSGLQEELYAAASREYEDVQTAGINIIDKNTNDVLITMDIGIRPIIGSRIYYYGEAEIKGVLPDEILADKITVLSSRMIFRRAKDIIDVFALSHCVKIDMAEILGICEKSGNEIKSFDEFLSRKADIEHAYNKLRGVEGKPDFEVVYSHLSKFLRPFIEKNIKGETWDNKTLKWSEGHTKS
ncbi:MAG: nucleotidyl transferase AbiEii/AbiGii toxin family protein [Oscillospiraceae bacterium]|nr:nucleotidyl transferase AbiEii/AbiGii toxin family protein [Oscillospiraceae bacterium]